MTVAELIEELKKLPQDARVMRDDYEYILVDLNSISYKEVIHYWDTDKQTWLGNDPISVVVIE